MTFPIRLLSIWDLFDRLDGSESAPFIETNYAPGLELAWVAPWSRNNSLVVRMGALHESNGLGLLVGGADNLAQSRSWNRAYLDVNVDLLKQEQWQLLLGGAAWIPFGSDPVEAWADEGRGDRIEDHVGVWEARLSLAYINAKLPDFRLSLSAHLHSLQVELRVSLKSYGILTTDGNGFRLDFVTNCHFGAGERLLIANENQSACYIGFGL